MMQTSEEMHLMPERRMKMKKDTMGMMIAKRSTVRSQNTVPALSVPEARTVSWSSTMAVSTVSAHAPSSL